MNDQPRHEGLAVPSDDDVFRITSREAIAALASPARQEVVDALAALAPATVAVLAEALGRAPSSLYYHLERLEAVGLVVRESRARSDGRTETLLRTPARRMVVDLQPRDEEDTALLHSLRAPIFRITERDLASALDASREHLASEREGDGPVATAGRTKGWLSDRDLEALLGHLRAIDGLLTHARPDEGGRLFAFTFGLASLDDGPGDAPSLPDDHA